MQEGRLERAVWWIGAVAAIAVSVVGFGFGVAAVAGLVLAPAAPWILGAALAAGLPALVVRVVRERRARPRDGRLATADRMLHLVLLVGGSVLAVCALALLAPAPLQNLGLIGALGSGCLLLVLAPASVLVTWLRAVAPRDPAVVARDADLLVRIALVALVALAVVALASGALTPLAHLRP